MTFFSFFCCKNEPEKILYYPSKDFFESEELVEIDLNNTELNFRGITGLVGKIYKADSIPFIELKDKNTTRKITPFRYDGGMVKLRNVLHITEDSILIDENHPISELHWILKRHYENNGEKFRYPQSDKHAMVEVTIDTILKGADLKKCLNNLTTVFDEINSQHSDSLKLRVFFDYFRQIPPPPPPPVEPDIIFNN